MAERSLIDDIIAVIRASSLMLAIDEIGDLLKVRGWAPEGDEGDVYMHVHIALHEELGRPGSRISHYRDFYGLAEVMAAGGYTASQRAIDEMLDALEEEDEFDEDDLDDQDEDLDDPQGTYVSRGSWGVRLALDTMFLLDSGLFDPDRVDFIPEDDDDLPPYAAGEILVLQAAAQRHGAQVVRTYVDPVRGHYFVAALTVEQAIAWIHEAHGCSETLPVLMSWLTPAGYDFDETYEVVERLVEEWHDREGEHRLDFPPDEASAWSPMQAVQRALSVEDDAITLTVLRGAGGAGAEHPQLRELVGDAERFRMMAVLSVGSAYSAEMAEKGVPEALAKLERDLEADGFTVDWCLIVFGTPGIALVAAAASLPFCARYPGNRDAPNMLVLGDPSVQEWQVAPLRSQLAESGWILKSMEDGPDIDAGQDA